MGGKWADKHIPTHIQHLLAAESSCNDGATFPFLFFALYLMTELLSIGNALRNWFLILWLCDCPFLLLSLKTTFTISSRPGDSRDRSRLFLLLPLDETPPMSQLD